MPPADLVVASMAPVFRRNQPRRTLQAIWAPLCCVGVLIVMANPRRADALEPQSIFESFRTSSWPEVAHSNVVWSVTQSQKGPVWIATRDGLVQFDGRQMIPFDGSRVLGLAVHEVTSVVEGRGGVLWVGARDGGLSAVRLVGSQGEVVAKTPVLVIRQMVEAPDGTIWIAAHNGMARVRPGDLTATFVNEGLPSLINTRVAIDASGTPWAGNVRGPFRWNGRSWDGVPGPQGLTDPADALLADSDGTVWVGRRTAGLGRWRAGSWRVYTREQGLPSDSPTALVTDQQGRLWTATAGGGVAWLDGERFRTLAIPPALCPDRVLSLMEDREQGLWMATRGCGLHRIRSPFFRLSPTVEGGNDSHVLSVAMIDGSPWAGTTTGMSRWNGTSWRSVMCQGGGCSGCWGLAPRQQGGGWVSCQSPRPWLAGDQSMRPAGDPVLDHAGFVLEAADGARWIQRNPTAARPGRPAGAIEREIGGVVTPIAEAKALEGRIILLTGRAGQIWMIGGNGVLSWDRGQATFIPLPLGMTATDPASAFEDAEGTLWIATRGSGIRRLREGRFGQIETRHGLPSGWLIQILEDQKGHIWASSGRGLLLMTKAEVEEVASGRRPSLGVLLFDAQEGAVMGEAPYLGLPAGTIDSAGRLWFATNKGVLMVDPAAPSGAGPPVVVDEIRVGGQLLSRERAAEGKVTGPQDIQVRFAAQTFEPSETVATRFRLEGWDTLWRDGGSSDVARYEGVPAGRYTFRMRSFSRSDESQSQEASFSLVLAVPLYRSPTFFGALVLMALGLLVWVHRLRLGHTRDGLAAVVAERTRIARDIHDTLAQSFVAASVRLECIDRALEDGDVPLAQRHLVTAREVVIGSLEEARRSVWVLRPQGLDEGLVPALRLMVQRISGHPTVDLVVEGKARRFSPTAEAHLMRIAQEAVSNAARHGKATAIHLAIRFEKRKLVVTVHDDGIGFVDGADDPAVPHLGLTGMRERVAEIGGTLTIQGTTAGTTVRVEAPV